MRKKLVENMLGRKEGDVGLLLKSGVARVVFTRGLRPVEIYQQLLEIQPAR